MAGLDTLREKKSSDIHCIFQSVKTFSLFPSQSFGDSQDKIVKSINDLSSFLVLIVSSQNDSYS